MSKAVLVSVRPKWCNLIADGKKTIEVRKSKPNLSTPFKCYIYCTRGKRYKRTTQFAEAVFFGKGQECSNGKVIGEFVCDRIYQYTTANCLDGVDISTDEMVKQSCLTEQELHAYENSAEPKEYCIYLIGLYGWHISDLVIYDTPKGLGEFMKPCENGLYCEECAMYREFTEQCGNKALVLSRPPQSWCYVEELPEPPKGE